MRRSVGLLGWVLSGWALMGSGCSGTDVGAPCSHAKARIPHQPAVTFPALACNDLYCVYADHADPPAEPCKADADCNTGMQTKRFVCNAGTCELSSSYVLERSMCSKRCSSDADCAGTADDTQCRTGFTCARFQTVGEYCCERLCVCRDDLGATDPVLEEGCAAGTLSPCCEVDPKPAGCGPE